MYESHPVAIPMLSLPTSLAKPQAPEVKDSLSLWHSSLGWLGTHIPISSPLLGTGIEVGAPLETLVFSTILVVKLGCHGQPPGELYQAHSTYQHPAWTGCGMACALRFDKLRIMGPELSPDPHLSLLPPPPCPTPARTTVSVHYSYI